MFGEKVCGVTVGCRDGAGDRGPVLEACVCVGCV